MKVAFFGLPLAALLLAGDGHEIVYAGVCRKNALGTRRLQKVARRVDVVPKANDPILQKFIRETQPDLVVSWFWTRKLPREILTLAPAGAIGVHPSLLPRHRGPDPYFCAIHEGDDKTGVTAHRLDESYDTGAILAQRTLVIDPSWNAWTLAKKLDRPSLTLLREVVMSISQGKAPAPMEQDESLATEAPSPTDDELAIDWKKSAHQILNLIRAAAPWPGATFTLEGEMLFLERGRVTDDFPRALVPGEAAVRSDDTAVVRAGTGAVELLAGRTEDDLQLNSAAFVDRVRRATREMD